MRTIGNKYLVRFNRCEPVRLISCKMKMFALKKSEYSVICFLRGMFMKYKKLSIVFVMFGLIGIGMYTLNSRFYEPVTQLETIFHTIVALGSLLLGVVGFFGAAYFLIVSLFHKQEDCYTCKEDDSTNEEYFFDFEKVFAEHDTYDGCTKQQILDATNNLLASINKFDEPIVATSDFLLLIDGINGLVRTLGEGYCPSRELQKKHISALCSLAQDVIEERSKYEKIKN